MTGPGQPREPRAQRARLGNELRQVRTLAGLTGRQMAGATGLSQPTIVRVERGESVPSRPQVQAWARAARVPADRRAILLALLDAAVNELVTYRQLAASGLADMQRRTGEREAVSATVRHFQPGIIPGLLQTADYALRIMEMSSVHGGTDLAEAVSARMTRQEALYDKARQFDFILTEAALRWRPGPPELLAGVHARIASVATLETVELAVIPGDALMHAITFSGFILYEDRSDGEPPMVAVETAHGELVVTDPADVESYRDQLALFRQSALTGPDAVAFVRSLA